MFNRRSREGQKMNQINISSEEVKKVSFDFGISLTEARKYLMLHKMKRGMLDSVGKVKTYMPVNWTSDEEQKEIASLNAIESMADCICYLFDKEINKVTPRNRRYK